MSEEVVTADQVVAILVKLPVEDIKALTFFVARAGGVGVACDFIMPENITPTNAARSFYKTLNNIRKKVGG